ncbi:hypothetical protein [Paenibacillus durus]|uniref:5-bromo-4-chloroindolyl phosphate hydrolase n=1 Tax=Paenibacillus durus ATCC 35681 TaxID=1333534 RepID=A0A0F7CGB4_PAEDU|nr:hypothetical protein [Paenibacillus durus]AKG33361.1 hypothetical protein VK70_01005 [Paenibacillus durus ATCC 35681]
MRYKIAIGITLLGYLFPLTVTSRFLPGALNLIIPTLFALGSILYLYRTRRGKQGPFLPSKENLPQRTEQASTSPLNSAAEPDESDPFWRNICDYIHVLEEMIISEGQKNNLDSEIVEKSLSVLTRVLRLVPQLKMINNNDINHNLQRLVFKDINGVINPFLNLSAASKIQNRRLLLNGIRDINSKLSQYVETIEQKDLMELRTKIDIIQKRYRSVD